MPAPLLLALVVMLGFVIWGAVLFWRGREPAPPPRHETRHERRKLHHKG